MDCSAIVLNKLLTDRDLDIWSKVKLVFLDPAFSSLYSAISKYYDNYGNIPSFEELELSLRDGPAQRTLAVVKLADNEDISSEVALNALVDQYTQNETIKLLDKFVDKLPVFDTDEIKENLSGIVLKLDEKTLTNEGVYNMSDIMLFKTADELANERFHLGLNNTFDATLAGVAREELILVGGRRGAGKSIVCSNVQVNQYENGFVSAYFTIEMVAYETFQRNMSILANVDHMRLKQNTLTPDEMISVISARANMFENSEDLIEEFRRHRDPFKFETQLVKSKYLRKDNQMIIIDDRALTISSLDLHLGKIKSKFGDKFTVAVLDYLNKIHLEGTDQFDWKAQLVVADKLKNLARKHKVIMFSPYQIDATGEARFAKGILDAADIAMILSPEENTISMDTTKIRGGPPINVTSPINWSSLRISPQSIERPPAKEPTIKRAGKKSAKTEESASDVSWEQ